MKVAMKESWMVVQLVVMMVGRMASQLVEKMVGQ